MSVNNDCIERRTKTKLKIAASVVTAPRLMAYRMSLSSRVSVLRLPVSQAGGSHRISTYRRMPVLFLLKMIQRAIVIDRSQPAVAPACMLVTTSTRVKFDSKQHIAEAYLGIDEVAECSAFSAGGLSSTRRYELASNENLRQDSLGFMKDKGRTSASIQSFSQWHYQAQRLKGTEPERCERGKLE